MRLIFLFIPFLMFGQLEPNYELSTFDSGYLNPMATEIINDSYYLVMERSGTVYLNGSPIITRSPNTIGEGGMLGLEHAKVNGVHYVWIYSTEGETDRYGNISLYELDLVNSSALFLTDILDDFFTTGFNHFGGSIFYKDGFIYCTFGDNQQIGKAQNDTDLNGKIVKIDAFTGDGVNGNRIYAKGFRNHFRCVLLSDGIGVADVGQASFEEYTEITENDNGAWWLKEGYAWQTTPQEIPNEKLPAFTYSHDSVDFETINGTINYNFNGVSIIGGVILDQFGYDGQLLFTDFFRDELLVANVQNNVLTDMNSIGFMPQSFNVHFTQYNGFVYVTNYANGNIYRIEYGGTLGVNEVEENERLIEKSYYNVLGQRVNKQKNVILIEVSKYENRVETKKIIK